MAEDKTLEAEVNETLEKVSSAPISPEADRRSADGWLKTLGGKSLQIVRTGPKDFGLKTPHRRRTPLSSPSDDLGFTIVSRPRPLREVVEFLSQGLFVPFASPSS